MRIFAKIVILLTCVFFVAPAFAQNELKIGEKNAITINGPAFIPFSAESNDLIESAISQGFPVSQCRATGIQGSDLEVGPAANGFEIGERRNIKRAKKKKRKKRKPEVVCDIDFTGGLDLPEGRVFGISVSGNGRVTLNLAQPGNCPTPISCEADENSARKCSTATNQKCCEADSNGNLAKKCKSDGNKCTCAK